MNGRARVALVILLALLVPPILVTNGIRLLANDWFVRFEYARLPSDDYGFTRAQRTRLGLVGLHSILPRYEEGIGLLRRARLPDGRTAFREKELRHMADVRRLIGVIYPAHLVALGLVAALAVVLGLVRKRRDVLRRGLQCGALLTLAVALFVGLALAVDAEGFLTGFHHVFFEGRSWRFREGDTLRRLYPDRFWIETAVLLGVGAGAQAALLLSVSRRRGQAIGRRKRTVLRARARPGS